jgi:hypothetical protein
MNSIFTKATVMACLLGPVIVAAANPNQTVYAGSSSSDAFTFSLDALSNVSIDYAWSDMLLTKNGPPHEYNAASLQWTLSGAGQQSGSFMDDTGSGLTGSGTLSLAGLTPGSYTLTLNGVWDDVTLPGNGNAGLINTAGHVNWRDGDQTGNQPELNSFNATTVFAIPEPASYAMVLVGLGLMGLVTRRRKSNQA